MFNTLRYRTWTAGCALALITACGGGDGGNDTGTYGAAPGDEGFMPAGGCSPGTTMSCGCPDGSIASQICGTDGLSYGPCQCGGGDSTSPTTNNNGNNVPDELPCNVGAIIEEHCQECHGAETKFGAPMSLTTASAFRADSSSPGKSIAQRALERVAPGADSPMPPPPYAALSEEEIAVLQNWVNQGTYGTTCHPVEPTGPVDPLDPTDPTDPTNPTDPTDPTNPTDPTDPTNPTDPVDPPPPTDPAVTCYEFRANANLQGPYDVPQTPDLYQCFTFAPPWGATPVQLTSAKAIIDNDVVIHHWILYNNSGAVADGANGGCSGAHPDAAFTAGWAPGGSDAVMPPDVGMEIKGQGFTLEIHYNNSAGQQFDASGVEVCVTDQMRPNTAAVHWLGTESINLPAGGDAVGTCRPQATGPVTILSSSPHMHLQGRHLKTVINRAAGGEDILIDVPFDFSSQVTYDTPQVVNPGDTLTTTCTFGGPAYFGQGTNEEMCYNFVTAYPAGGLSQGVSFARQYGCTGL